MPKLSAHSYILLVLNRDIALYRIYLLITLILRPNLVIERRSFTALIIVSKLALKL